MAKLGKKVQYGLVALVHLDRIAPGSRASTHELSERYGIPEPHLGKVLQRMSRAGLLQSRHGAQGGYELEVPLASLTLGELSRAVEDRKPPRETPHTVLSLFPACFAQGLTREVENRVSNMVDQLSIVDLLDQIEFTETEKKEFVG